MIGMTNPRKYGTHYPVLRGLYAAKHELRMAKE